MPSPQTVSAIVAAYNEAKTVKPILTTLANHPQVTEVIAVDDGSTDKTWQKIQSVNSDKLIPLRHQVNLGKGAAIADAVRKAKGEVLLFIDADLRKFHPAHIDLLLAPLQIDPKSMTIGLREPLRPFEKTISVILKILNGERAFTKKLILPLLPRIAHSGYGVETIINLHFNRHRYPIYYIPLPGLIHILKQEKHPLYKYAVDYFHEGKQILKQYLQTEVGSTDSFLEYLTKVLRV